MSLRIHRFSLLYSLHGHTVLLNVTLHVIEIILKFVDPCPPPIIELVPTFRQHLTAPAQMLPMTMSVSSRRGILRATLDIVCVVRMVHGGNAKQQDAVVSSLWN
jgi:hypothetical protein